MSNYETSVMIGGFAGLMQDTDGHNLNLKYAVEAINCDTSGSGLKPMKGYVRLKGSVPSPIGTLMRLHRRYVPTPSERDVLVAVCDNGSVYTRLMNDATGEWTLRKEGLRDSIVDYVAYEKNLEGSDAPTDVLLFTNATDGMFCLYGDDLHVEGVDTNGKRFGILARHAERIWGGGIAGDPDMLMYSAPYDPFNWKQNDEIPEDGAGDILQPSWDGDSFIALRPYGSYLMAYKRDRLWRILGTDPGTYVMKEQFGDGCVAENTLAQYEAYQFMLGYSGLLRYDGTAVEPYRQAVLKDFYASINRDAIRQACAARVGNMLYMAVPVDGSEHNNRIMVYSLKDGTFNLCKGVNVKSFLAIEDKLLFTSYESPGYVFEFGTGSALPMKWVSAWQDMNAKSVMKSNFCVYLGVEAVSELTMQVTIRTEKKVKTKLVRLTPGKVKRIRINAPGRMFRFELECDERQNWKLMGGIQLDMELDPE